MNRPRRPIHGDRPRVGQLSVDEDVQKELDFHIEMRTQELVELGWDAAEARREAERRFGNVSELSKECRSITRSADKAEVRAVRMDALMQDLRYGLRVLRKAPAFAALAILTLALGIGANTAIFSLVYGVLLKPLPYSDSERIVSIREHQPSRGNTMSVAIENFRDWDRESSSFEALAAHNAWSQTIRGGEQPFRAVTAQVSADLLAVFRIVPVAGRTLVARDYDPGAEPVVLISDDVWQREYGGQPLDQIHLEVYGVAPRVVGVVPSSFDYPGGSALWVPLLDDNTSRSAHNYRVVGRLAPGATLDRADAELDQIQARVTEAERGEDAEYVAEAVEVQTLRAAVAGDTERPLTLLFGAAGLVLLIGCTNLASTLLARGSLRSRELNVRQAVGAGRGRLTRQLLTESCLLALFGGAVGLALAQGILLLLKGTEGASIPRLEEVSLDPRALAFAAAASIFTGFLFGLLPAIRLSEANPGEALRTGDRGQGAGGKSGLWGPLVAAEVALAFVLLSGSLLLVRSFQEVLSADRGFATEGVLTADIDLDPNQYEDGPAYVAFYEQLLADLTGRPGVDAAGIASSVPVSGQTPDGRLELDGDLSKQATGLYVAVSGGFFDAMGIPMLQGRPFDERDRADAAHVAIVSKAFADQYWPGEDPIGRQVTGGGMDAFWESRDFATVIGVVGDTRYIRLVDAPEPIAYFPFSQRPTRVQRVSTLVARTGQGPASGLTQTLRDALSTHDPDIRVQFQTMDDRIEGSVAQRRFTMSLLGGFALIALLLSAIGIYGVVSFSVARRTREMGIRIALGGSRSQIRRMIQRQSMVAVVAGAAFGLVAAVAFGRILESALFEVESTDPLTLLAAGAALLVTALGAATVPAIRSTRVDPLTAMRVD